MKKMSYKSAIACAALLALASCRSAREALPLSALNGEWSITEVDGRKLPDAALPFIGFDVARQQIYGNSGCNQLMGTIEADSLKPGSLWFGAVGSTRMMCPDMDTEQSVLAAIAQVKAYRALPDAPEAVALCDAHGKQLMRLEKREATASPLSGNAGE